MFRFWEADVSNFEGCTVLHNPKPSAPRTPLNSPTFPILALTDAPDFTHVSVERVVEHTPHGGLLFFYDSRQLGSKMLLPTNGIGSKVFLRKGMQGGSSLGGRISIT